MDNDFVKKIRGPVLPWNVVEEYRFWEREAERLRAEGPADILPGHPGTEPEEFDEGEYQGIGVPMTNPDWDNLLRRAQLVDPLMFAIISKTKAERELSSFTMEISSLLKDPSSMHIVAGAIDFKGTEFSKHRGVYSVRNKIAAESGWPEVYITVALRPAAPGGDFLETETTYLLFKDIPDAVSKLLDPDTQG